jgi:hypothetical protein
MTRSVRQLQPTIGSLGSYGIAQLTAPRVPVPQTNNLLELAKGLNVVSDIVTTYDQIKQTQSRQQAALEKARALKGKERKAYEEALMTEGATQFDLDPGGVSRQMEAYEREVRKLTEEGKMPPQANALFMLGAKQAKGQVLAKSVYREMLFNPQTISETISPEETVLQKRQELFSRPEFQSELVKQAALEEIEKVEQDFIKDVNARFDAVDIEDGKNNRLGMAERDFNQFLTGDIDINDKSLNEWVNHTSGIFKGSHKHALDNLMKPALMNLVESGGSVIALDKLDAIEGWVINPNTGAKFVNAELKNNIDTLRRDIESKGSYYQTKATELYNKNKSKVIDPYIAEVKEKLNNGDFSDSYFEEWIDRLRTEGSESSVSKNDVEQTVIDMRALADKSFFNADSTIETNPTVWSTLQADLDKGLDVLEDAQDAHERGDLSFDDLKSIQKLNGDSDRFNKEVMEGISAVKVLTESFRNQFKDTRLTEEMRINGISPATTNAIKDITKLNAHPNTLASLKIRGMMAWRTKLKEIRDSIVKANPNITPQQLDEVITNQSIDLYESFNEDYKNTLLSELRTGKYIIDASNETITVEGLDKAIKGIETGNTSLVDEKIEDLIKDLEFPDNLDERLQFLRAYKDKIK